MSRKKARDLSFKLIFEYEFLKTRNSLSLEDFLLSESISEEDKDYITSVYDGYLENYDKVSKIISDNLKGYTIDRVYKVDLAILALAVYEIEFVKDTPVKIVINEAVNLSKKYSTDNSYKFVNGVLAKIVNKGK